MLVKGDLGEICSMWIHSTKQTCRHFVKIFTTGYTESCYLDNIRWSQVMKISSKMVYFVSVLQWFTMSAMASQITGDSPVCSTICSSQLQRSVSLTLSVRKTTGGCGFPAQRANDAKILGMSRRHRDKFVPITMTTDKYDHCHDIIVTRQR